MIEYILGLIYLSQEDYPGAAAEFERAIALTEGVRQELSYKPRTIHEVRTISRTLAIYHLVLGRTLAAQRKPDQARGEYEIAESCDPEYGPTYIGFGNIGYSEGQCQRALGWYEKAVELVPRKQEASAFYACGNAHFCLGQYEAAVVDYELAIKRADPDDRSLGLYHLVLGITLCRLDRSAEGVEEIRQALRLVEPDTNLQEAATAELEKCRVQTTVATPTPTSIREAVPTPTLTRTPFFTTTLTPTPTSTFFPTTTPTPMPTFTPFPTPIPGATVPEPIAPAMGREFRNPITFRWCWTVSVVQNGRALVTSSDWMLWFEPVSSQKPGEETRFFGKNLVSHLPNPGLLKRYSSHSAAKNKSSRLSQSHLPRGLLILPRDLLIQLRRRKRSFKSLSDSIIGSV